MRFWLPLLLIGTGVSPAGAVTDHPPIAGEWIADVLFEDSTSVQMVVDLGLAGSRLTGEFDVLDWGVENYPVKVTLGDSTVYLHFAGPNAEFVGTFRGESMIGVVAFQDHNLPIEFQRIGEARFSDLPPARERRRRFNAHGTALANREGAEGAVQRRCEEDPTADAAFSHLTRLSTRRPCGAGKCARSHRQ